MRKHYASSAAESLLALRTIIAILSKDWPDKSTDDKTEFLPRDRQGVYEFFEETFMKLAENEDLAPYATTIATRFGTLKSNELYGFSLETRRKFANMLGLPFIEKEISPMEGSVIVSGSVDAFRDMTDYCKDRLPFKLENRRMLIEAANTVAVMLTRELIGYCLGEDTERNGYCAKNIYFNLALSGCSDELLSFYLYCQEGIDAINSLERTVYNLETFEMFSTEPVNNECFAAFDKVFELTSKFYAEKSLGGVSTAPMHFAENLTQTYRNAMSELGYGDLLNPAIQISVFNPYGSLDYFEASKIMSDLFKSIQIAILRRLSDDANTELIGALSDAIDADSAKG